MNTLETILKRHSTRSFKDEQIKDEDLNRILIAANAAPVGMAKYDDLSITVIQNKELLNKIEENATKVMPSMPNKHPLYNAPTCILVSKINDQSPMKDMHTLNVACIVENMLLEATELNLGNIFIMGAVSALSQNKELCKELKVPEDYIPVAIAAIGYKKEEQTIKEETTSKIKLNILK